MKDRHIAAGAVCIIFIVAPGSFTIDFCRLWHSASVFSFRFTFNSNFNFFLESLCHQLPANQRPGSRLSKAFMRAKLPGPCRVDIPCRERETFYGCCVVAQNLQMSQLGRPTAHHNSSVYVGNITRPADCRNAPYLSLCNIFISFLARRGYCSIALYPTTRNALCSALGNLFCSTHPSPGKATTITFL